MSHELCWRDVDVRSKASAVVTESRPSDTEWIARQIGSVFHNQGNIGDRRQFIEIVVRCRHRVQVRSHISSIRVASS
jgi:hypothetical protein